MAVLLLLPVALKAQDIVEISNGNHLHGSGNWPGGDYLQYHVQRLVVFCDPQC